MNRKIELTPEQVEVLTGLIEDTIQDEEFDTAWMDDQKAALGNIWYKLKKLKEEQ